MEHDENFYLKHFGVKGMKWGVRKDRSGGSKQGGVSKEGGGGSKQAGGDSKQSNPKSAVGRFKDIRNYEAKTLELKSKNGEPVTLKEGKKPLISAVAAAAHPKLHENIKNSTAVSLHVGGKRVGDADFAFQGKNREEMYLNMIMIDSKHRGKGYASTVLDAAVELGRNEGAERITLEVPGNAPDAKHIYKKLGFKESGPTQTGDEIDTVWGGLTPMALEIPSNKKVKHAATETEPEPDEVEPGEVDDAELEKAFEQHFGALLTPDVTKGGGEEEAEEEVEDEMAQNDDESFYLKHYGIKGMKWGVKKAKDSVSESRKSRAAAKKAPASSDHNTATAARKKASQGGLSKLSNKELQDAINRMNLESQYKTLQAKNPTPQQAAMNYGKKIALSVAKDMAKTTMKNVVANNVKDPRVAELIKKTM